MPNDIVIQGRRIGSNHPPFIVAEMSGNHNQSLERALAIADAAATCGAHALKLQTYTADTMTLNLREGDFYIKDPNLLWKETSLYDLYQKAHTPWDWHKKIFDRCQEHGIIGFSAPFDPTAVDFLESLDVPCYKIASFENGDLALIKKVASTGKPLIISTGMATQSELDDAVQTARQAGCKDLILLKCTSAYPASSSDSNLVTIPALRKRYECHVGLSDHTLGITVPLTSIALGVVLIEKHITLSKCDGGVDSEFSLEPEDLKALVSESEQAWKSLGVEHYGATEKEKPSLIFRRSLYVVADMKAGEIFTPQNIRSIRPGHGLAPKHYDAFLGKKAKRDIKKGTPVQWDLV